MLLEQVYITALLQGPMETEGCKPPLHL